MPRPVIYFGSSFNPITHAHMDMIKHMIKNSREKNPRPMILLAPVYSHILSKPDLAKYEPRLEMLELAVQDLKEELKKEGIELGDNDLIVSRMDEDAYKATEKTGTLPVLQYLVTHAEKYDIDVNDISMVLGNDTYEDILGGVWNKAEEILKICKHIHVFDRDNKPVLEPMVAVDKAQAFCEWEMVLQPDDKLTFIKTRLERLPLVKLQVAMLGPDYFIIHQNKVREEHRTTSSTGIRNDFEKAKVGVAKAVLNYMETHPWVYKSTDSVVGVFVSDEDNKKNITEAMMTFLRETAGEKPTTDDAPGASHCKKNKLD